MYQYLNQKKIFCPISLQGINGMGYFDSQDNFKTLSFHKRHLRQLRHIEHVEKNGNLSRSADLVHRFKDKYVHSKLSPHKIRLLIGAEFHRLPKNVHGDLISAKVGKIGGHPSSTCTFRSPLRHFSDWKKVSDSKYNTTILLFLSVFLLIVSNLFLHPFYLSNVLWFLVFLDAFLNAFDFLIKKSNLRP